MKISILFTFFLPLNLTATETVNYPAPLTLFTQQGGEVVSSFKAPANMTGYIANFQNETITLYVTEEEKYLFTGPLVDTEGNSVGEEKLNAYVNGPKAVKNWQALENSHWVRDGSASAKRIVYTFTDPNCPYCKQLWDKARPWVDSGKVQIRHILVGILKADSLGKAAAILSADNPEEQLKKLAGSGLFQSIKPIENPEKTIRDKLINNYKTMLSLGARATPATFYLNADGEFNKQIGLPPESILADIFAPNDGK